MTDAMTVSAMDEQPTPNDDVSSGGSIFTSHRKTQLLTSIASVCGFVVCWWSSIWAGVPPVRGYQGSLLRQPAWPVAVLVAYLLLVIGLIVGSLIAGRRWFFAGLFSATIGWTALSIRGGTMHSVLQDAAAQGSAQRIFLLLAVEQFLLFIPVAALWTWLWRSYHVALARQQETPKQTTAANAANPPGLAIAIGAQAVIMGVIVLLLTATDLKKQVLISLFIAGFSGTSLTEHFVPNRKASAWYWIGPLVVGLAGYLLAYFNSSPVTTGEPLGSFAALARPLPLDYASAGLAGSLLGYWIGAEHPQLAMPAIGSLAFGRVVRLRVRQDSAAPSDNGSPLK